MAESHGEAAAWRELAERLLQAYDVTRAEVFVGALPASWPADLPLPSGARLLGSSFRTSTNAPFGNIEAVLDAEGTPSDVLASYQAELGRQGWAVFEMPTPAPKGFVLGDHPLPERRSLSRGREGPLVTVSALSRGTGLSDVRLRLDPPRKHPFQPARFWPPLFDRVPTLRAPAGVLLSHDGGYGGGDAGWSSGATAHTDMAVGELESHFARQLVDLGWMRLAGGEDGVVAWGSWRLPGEGGLRGLLLVHGAFAADARSLQFRIEAEGGGVRNFHA